MKQYLEKDIPKQEFNLLPIGCKETQYALNLYHVTLNDIDTLKNYEVVMYDVMSLVAFEDNRDILMNKQMFKVAILGDIDELDVFKNFRTDGWILADRLDKMPEFLDLIQTKI